MLFKFSSNGASVSGTCLGGSFCFLSLSVDAWESKDPPKYWKSFPLLPVKCKDYEKYGKSNCIPVWVYNCTVSRKDDKKVYIPLSCEWATCVLKQETCCWIYWSKVIVLPIPSCMLTECSFDFNCKFVEQSKSCSQTIPTSSFSWILQVTKNWRWEWSGNEASSVPGLLHFHLVQPRPQLL